MPRAQADLENRLGQHQPFRGDAARVAPPGVEQSSLSTAVISRAKRFIRHNEKKGYFMLSV